MNTLISFFTEFGSDTYMLWSRVEGTLWTAADIAIALLLIACADLCRRATGARPHRIAPLIVYASIVPSLLLPFTPTPGAFYRLELFVTIPQFLVIIYVLVANRNVALRALHLLTQPETK
jgi:hypothetical protein